jgi:hypothetical protein
MGNTYYARTFLRRLGESYAKKWSGKSKLDLSQLGKVARIPTVADGAKFIADRVQTLTDPRKRQGSEMQGRSIPIPFVGNVNLNGTQVTPGPKMLQGAVAPDWTRKLREFAKTAFPQIIDDVLGKVPGLGHVAQAVTDSAFSTIRARRRKTKDEIKGLLEIQKPDAEELRKTARTETQYLDNLVQQIREKREQVSDAKKTYMMFFEYLEPKGHGPCYYFSHLYGYAYYYWERRQQLDTLLTDLEEYCDLMHRWVAAEDENFKNYLTRVDNQLNESLKTHKDDEDCGINCYLQINNDNKQYPQGFNPPPPMPKPLPKRPPKPPTR